MLQFLRRSITFSMVAIACSAVCTSAPADVISLADDVKLEGTVVEVVGENLLVQPYAGGPELRVKLTDVVEVTFRDTGGRRIPPSTRPSTQPSRLAVPKDVPATLPASMPSTEPAVPESTTKPAIAAVPRVNEKRRGTTMPAAPPASQRVGVISSAKVTITDGQSLTGSIFSWGNGILAMRSTLSGNPEFNVPLDRVREIWSGSADQIKKAKALAEPVGLDDVAYASKDKDVLAVHGVALGIENGALLFRYGNETRKIALARIVGITLASQSDRPAPREAYQTLNMLGGEIVAGRWTEISDSYVTFTTLWGQSVRLPFAQARSIQFRNGRLTYLTDLVPVAVEQTPYFDHATPHRINTSIGGRPLVIQDGPVELGIAVQSRSVLSYDIAGGYDQFRCRVGYQQPEGVLGQAIVRVLGDGKVLQEIPEARGDQPPIEISVSIAGVRRLTLEVDFGAGQDVGDRVVWANPRLTRAGE